MALRLFGLRIRQHLNMAQIGLDSETKRAGEDKGKRERERGREAKSNDKVTGPGESERERQERRTTAGRQTGRLR